MYFVRKMQKIINNNEEVNIANRYKIIYQYRIKQ